MRNLAILKYQMPESLMNKIEKASLGTWSKQKILQAGADVVLPVFSRNLKDAIGNTKYRSRSTGELVRSLGVSPMMPVRRYYGDRDRNNNPIFLTEYEEISASSGFDIKIGFNEPRRKQPKEMRKIRGDRKPRNSRS